MVRQGVGLRPPEAGLQVPVPAVAAVHGLTAVYHFLEGFPNVRHGRRMPLHPAVQVINDHLSRFWSGDRSATWWTQPAADAASAWTSSQPWYTTARPVNRTPGYCRASRWSVT